MNERERFTVAIRCPDCGQVGSAAWEENAADSRQRGVHRELILLSNGFHRSRQRGQSGDPGIICDRCDAMLAD
jgi:hypothetical protein